LRSSRRCARRPSSPRASTSSRTSREFRRRCSGWRTWCCSRTSAPPRITRGGRWVNWWWTTSCRGSRGRDRSRRCRRLRGTGGEFSSMLGHHHDLPLHLPLLHPNERRGDFRQPDAFAHHRLDLAGRVQLSEPLYVSLLARRILPRPLSPVDPDDRSLLEEREIEADGRNLSRGETDHEQPPAPG